MLDFGCDFGSIEYNHCLLLNDQKYLANTFTVEKNERCDDVDELHNLCKKLKLAIDQEADQRYAVDQSLQAFKLACLVNIRYTGL